MVDPGLDVALRARTNVAFRSALQRCAEAGEAGDEALARALPLVSRDRRVYVAVVLGDLRGGSAGVEALSLALHAPESSQDLRCSALLALAKRAQREASADFAAGFVSRDSTVKRYALIALAAYGDDRAWDEVMRYLDRKLAKRTPGKNEPPGGIQRSPACWATCYLSRHLGGPTGRPRSEKLVKTLRRSGDALAEQWTGPRENHRSDLNYRAHPPHVLDATSWFEQFWPTALNEDVPVGQVTPPKLSELEAWIRLDPLLDPVQAGRECRQEADPEATQGANLRLPRDTA